MSNSFYNKSHCYDPTAKFALDNIERKGRTPPPKPNYIGNIGERLDPGTIAELYRVASRSPHP